MKKISRLFADVDTWVFDLENTLYPHHVNLWHQVDARISEFVGTFLGIAPDEARRIQKDYYLRYGTTMRGMLTEHGVHADDYARLGIEAHFEAVFDIIAAELEPKPSPRPMRSSCGFIR